MTAVQVLLILKLFLKIGWIDTLGTVPFSAEQKPVFEFKDKFKPDNTI